MAGNVRQANERRHTYVEPVNANQADETMDDIAQDTISSIRDGWSGWAYIFARDAARKAFAENPQLRMIYCPECDRIMDGTAGTKFTVATAEGEDYRTAYLCLSCAAWFIQR